MAALDFNTILKIFYSGPLVKQKRYKMIVKKVKEKTPFLLTTGDSKVLEFISTTVRTKFETGNLQELAAVAAKKNRPLKDEDGNTYSIRQIEKTEEFGGKTGGGRAGGGADPHELMTAALIAKYGAAGSNRVPVSAYNTLTQAEKIIGVLKSTAATVQGYRQKDIDAFDGDFANYAKAISAANGFLGAMNSSSRVRKVYITGKQWSKEVSKYRVTNHEYFGKKDYNSSDIVVDLSAKRGSTPMRVLVGVSLKKKKKYADKDPTIINKTVTGERGLFAALGVKSSDMRDELEELYLARSQFFYNMVEATLYSPDTQVGRRVRNSAVTALSIGDGKKEGKELVKREKAKLLGIEKKTQKILKNIEERGKKETEEVLQKNIRNYLDNLKKNVSSNEQKSRKVTKAADTIGTDKAKDALIAKFPIHTKLDNIYFRKFFSIMTSPKVSQLIAKSLMNIIFKLDINGLMKERAKYNEEFKFTLITGSGDLVNDVEITPFGPSVIPEESSTSMITEMVSRPGVTYQIRGLDGYTQPFDGGKSKSLKFEIMLQSYSIVEIEIRYKGSVTPEPQFQAYITATFKKLLKDRKAPDVRY